MTTSGRSIVGDKRKEGDRDENDFYPTPYTVINDIKRIIINLGIDLGYIWENAAGDNRIVDSFANTIGSDIIDRFNKCEAVDFIKNPHWYLDTFGRKPTTILTNPPFKIISNWVKLSLDVAERYVIIFAKLVFLSSKTRGDLLFGENTHLRYAYVYSTRPKLKRYEDRDKIIGTGLIDYAWFIFDKENTDEPIIRWISKYDDIESLHTFFEK